MREPRPAWARLSAVPGASGARTRCDDRRYGVDHRGRVLRRSRTWTRPANGRGAATSSSTPPPTGRSSMRAPATGICSWTDRTSPRSPSRTSSLLAPSRSRRPPRFASATSWADPQHSSDPGQERKTAAGALRGPAGDPDSSLGHSRPPNPQTTTSGAWCNQVESHSHARVNHDLNIYVLVRTAVQRCDAQLGKQI